jgi:hypothetical protein
MYIFCGVKFQELTFFVSSFGKFFQTGLFFVRWFPFFGATLEHHQASKDRSLVSLDSSYRRIGVSGALVSVQDTWRG